MVFGLIIHAHVRKAQTTVDTKMIVSKRIVRMYGGNVREEGIVVRVAPHPKRGTSLGGAIIVLSVQNKNCGLGDDNAHISLRVAGIHRIMSART